MLKKTLSILLCSILLVSAGIPALAFGGMPEVVAEYPEVMEMFEQHEYTDAAGNVMPYNIYLPDGYEDSEEKYPMVIFIADASANSDEVTDPLKQTGATIWATPEEQAKHPCIVLVPQYTRVLQSALGDLTAGMGQPYTEGGWTNGLALLKEMMDDVVANYRVDVERIYGTGQSQGGMATIAVSSFYPNFYAAVYLVACQWDPNVMDVMAEDNIWMIVCEGDTIAYPYLSDAAARWAELGANVVNGEEPWSLSATEEEFAANVKAMRDAGGTIYFNVFSGGSHMETWPTAYKIEGIRDWLFEQVKGPDSSVDVPEPVAAPSSASMNAGPDAVAPVGGDAGFVPGALPPGGPGGPGPAATPVNEADIEGMIADAAEADLGNVYKQIANAYKSGMVMDADGNSLPADYEKAVEYYKMAGELGDGFAYFDAGQIYEQGQIGGTPDYANAEDCYIKAAEASSSNCKGLRNVGQWYELGNEYAEVDYEKAAHYYEWAIETDDASSCYYLGNMYQQGYLSEDGEPDYENAALYYQKGADKNNDSATGIAKALYQLGYLYENGLGVEADEATAFALYKRAVAAGQEKLEELYTPAVMGMSRLASTSVTPGMGPGGPGGPGGPEGADMGPEGADMGPEGSDMGPDDSGLAP